MLRIIRLIYSSMAFASGGTAFAIGSAGFVSGAFNDSHDALDMDFRQEVGTLIATSGIIAMLGFWGLKKEWNESSPKSVVNTPSHLKPKP